MYCNNVVILNFKRLPRRMNLNISQWLFFGLMVCVEKLIQWILWSMWIKRCCKVSFGQKNATYQYTSILRRLVHHLALELAVIRIPRVLLVFQPPYDIAQHLLPSNFFFAKKTIDEKSNNQYLLWYYFNFVFKVHCTFSFSFTWHNWLMSATSFLATEPWLAVLQFW